MAGIKSMICPTCHRKVATWDGRSTNNIEVKCKKCKKNIIFNVITNEVKSRKTPQRNSSSGMRFY